MTKEEKQKLVKSLMAFTQSAVIALIDGKVSATEAADLIAKGEALVKALRDALKKD